MSEPDLAYMTANEEFDLPRWQTHHTQSSIGHQDPAYAFNSVGSNASVPQQQSLGPPPQQRSTASGPRVQQIQASQDSPMIANYSGTVGRSNSLQASSSSRRRQHHTTNDLEIGGSSTYSSTQNPTSSLYPHSVAYVAKPPSSEEINLPIDGGMAYLTGHQTPKRQQGDTPGQSPLRSSVSLDPYAAASQHSVYPSTSASSPPASYAYPPNDTRSQSYHPTQQQQQSRPRTQSSVKTEPSGQPLSLTAGPYPVLSASGSSTSAYTSSQYPMEISTSSSSPMSTSQPTPAQQQQQQHLAFATPISRNQHSSMSTPSTPLSFAPSNNQGSFYQHDTPMAIEQAQTLPSSQQQKRRPVGFRRVREARELRPMVNTQPQGRRVGADGAFLSPVKQLTTNILDTYHICNPQFRYESALNPRRVLTKPSKPAHNDGYDNEDYDYVLYVNDLLGSDDGNKYLILDVLGQGTFGQVVKCQNMKTNEIVAVKVVKNKPAYFNQSMMEVTILELLNTQWDPNDEHHLLRMRDSFIHKNHLCLVFELLSSNLYELIKQNQFQGLSAQLVRVFTAQLLDAMTVLKEARLIHCDLKPENILLKSLQSPQIKIIDFGSACHERQTVYTYIQSRFYRSPEVLLGIPYTAAIDMWSLGCIAVELFLGLPLFPGTSEYNQVTRIVEMLGLPSVTMLDAGKQTHQFFDVYTDHYGAKKYRLKSLEQYSREHNTNEQPGKQYFKATTLPEIINTAPMPAFKSSRQGHEEQKELNNRASFVDFCQGLLHLDPIQRWTPQQARMHPFITGEKFTRPYTPKQQPVAMQVTPIAPSTSASVSIPSTQDSKRPYGGLVPTQPKGTRAYQDAASYNQHLAQHQAFTAQAQAASQAANAFRNPYVAAQSQAQPPIVDGHNGSYGSQQTAFTTTSSSVMGSRESTSGQLKQNVSSQYLGGNNGSVPIASQQNPANTFYASASRGRSNTGSGQLDVVPPALARLQLMNQDVIAGRKALTPVLNRDDATREWERRQSGKPPAAQPYPQLEHLQQQAEMAATGQTNWAQPPTPSSGRYQPPTSKLSHSYAPTIIVDDDRRDSSGRHRTDANSSYNNQSIAAPAQTYNNSSTTSGNRYAMNYPQQAMQQQVQPMAFDSTERRMNIESIYVPMQPEQYQQYSSTSNQVLAPVRNVPPPVQAMVPSFYGASIQASGHQTPINTLNAAQRNPFTSNDLSRNQSLNDDSRRQNNSMDVWPR